MKMKLAAPLMFLAILSQGAKASIVYQVDIGSGPLSLIGTITTDGATGKALKSSDIVGWNLIATQGSSVDLTNKNSSLLLLGSDLTATSTGLFFNFTSQKTSAFSFVQTIRGDISAVCFDNAAANCGGNASSITISTNGQPLLVQSIYESGNSEIGAVAAVPELSTWAMIILGFCGLGFMSYRRQQTGGSSLSAV